MKKLSRSFYKRNTILVAKDLLGKYLVRIANGEKIIGKIVEVEAYLGPHDLAAHSAKGLTERTKILFGSPGFAYVYQIYGIHYCLNVVTERKGSGAAVLIRALEPIQNLPIKLSGPGLLCKAMNIDKRLNGHDLTSEDFFIAIPDTVEKFTIKKTPRIGVAYAKHWAKKLLRFYIKDNLSVSHKNLN